MNLKKSIFLGLLFCFTSSAYSQNTEQETISNIEVFYSVIENQTNENTERPEILVHSKALISMIEFNVNDTLFYEIISTIDNHIIYQKSFSAGLSSLFDSNGKELYARNGLLVTIICPDVLKLELYKYNLYTKNNNDTVSKIFTTIR